MQRYSIGSDESLKGDTFGGLVVAAVLVNDEQKIALSSIGVMDSKKLADARIVMLAKQIKALCPYHVVKEVLPEEYNQFKQTDLLNQMHHECASILRLKHIEENDVSLDQEEENYASYTHIVDQYPGCKVGDVQKTKAESLYVEVAAASILARDQAVRQINELSKEIGFKIPLGSTHVSEALVQLKASKRAPDLFVKMHFKNVQEALGSAFLKNQAN